MGTNGETYYLWVDKGRGAEATTRTFVWGDYGGLGHKIICLRDDDLAGEVAGKRKEERPFDPLKVLVGFGSDKEFVRWFDGEELKTAESARRKKREELKRRGGLPTDLPD